MSALRTLISLQQVTLATEPEPLPIIEANLEHNHAHTLLCYSRQFGD